MTVFRQKFLHESCTSMSIENFGTNFSPFGVIGLMLCQFWYNWSFLDRLPCTIYFIYKGNSNEKVLNYKVVDNDLN